MNQRELPLYKKEAFIRENIESILEQAYANIKVIVVDNCSTDSSVAIVEEFENKNIRLTQCATQGVCSARNHGVSLAKGEWILFLDGDDQIEPSHIQGLIDLAHPAEDVDIVAGGWVEVSEVSGKSEVKLPPRPEFIRKYGAPWISYPPWAVHAAIVRKARLTDVFLWPVELNVLSCEDIVFWFKLTQVSKIEISNSISAKYRVQVADGRTTNDDYKNWCNGYLQAISLNVSFLQNQGLNDSPLHHEAIVRSTYTLLKKLYVSHPGHDALPLTELIDKHTSLYFTLTRGASLGMRIRKWFGPEVFLRIERFFR